MKKVNTSKAFPDVPVFKEAVSTLLFLLGEVRRGLSLLQNFQRGGLIGSKLMGGFPKKWGLGQFAGLRRGLAKNRGGVFLSGDLYPKCTLAFREKSNITIVGSMLQILNQAEVALNQLEVFGKHKI